jgi:hypothetical protein
MLFRDANGVNFGKLYAQSVFQPSSTFQARSQISGRGKDYLMSKSPFDEL